MNAEGQLLRMQTLRKLLHELETSEETKASLIKRMQSEAQTGERSHAMRTALLATVEAQLAEVQAELKGKQETESEIVAKVHTLQVELSETHKKLQEKKRELEDKCIEMTDTVNEERRQYDMLVNTLKIKHNEVSATYVDTIHTTHYTLYTHTPYPRISSRVEPSSSHFLCATE